MISIKKYSDLNKSNKYLREVYSAGNGNYHIYLSIDFETGGFEVCDYNNTWLGKYWFDGEENEKKNTKNEIVTHSTILKLVTNDSELVSFSYAFRRCHYETYSVLIFSSLQ